MLSAFATWERYSASWTGVVLGATSGVNGPAVVDGAVCDDGPGAPWPHAAISTTDTRLERTAARATRLPPLGPWACLHRPLGPITPANLARSCGVYPTGAKCSPTPHQMFAPRNRTGLENVNLGSVDRPS